MAKGMAEQRAEGPVAGDTDSPDPTLAGYHLLVTRPAPDADALCKTLQAAGATTYRAPMLAIEMLEASPEQRAIAQNLDRYAHVIVTSRHAVSASLPLLADFWPQWPLAQHWFAVGNGTADALTRYGIDAQVPEDTRSEGLLALPLLTNVADARILLVCGEGGRQALTQTLTQRHAQVTRLAMYRRHAGSECGGALDAFRDIRAAIGRRIALVTSAGALQNLLALTPWLPGSDVALLVVSERIAAIARQAGIRDVFVAAGAGDEHTLSALLQRAASA